MIGADFGHAWSWDMQVLTSNQKDPWNLKPLVVCDVGFPFMGVPPKSSIEWIFHYKPSILGTPAPIHGNPHEEPPNLKHHCHGWWHFQGTRRLALQKWRSAVEAQRQWQAMNDQVGSGWDDMGVSINGDPQSGWFIMGNPTKMADLGVPLFQETFIWQDDIMRWRTHQQILYMGSLWIVSISLNHLDHISTYHFFDNSRLVVLCWSLLIVRGIGCFIRLLSCPERMAPISPPNPFVCSSSLICSASFSGTGLQNITAHRDTHVIHDHMIHYSVCILCIIYIYIYI